MTAFKKYTQLTIAFLLGVLITYLAMSLHLAKQELKAKSSQTLSEPKLDPSSEKSNAEDANHWLDERIEQQTTETQERIKQQQSQGDELKSKFEEFAK